jgi:Holliday junction resolvase RusA-like endonuclease
MSLEIRVVPFEPFAWVAGKRTGKREDKLSERIRQEIPLHRFTEFLEGRADRLVALRVQFFLWEGSSNVTNTRSIKDVDNLLNVVFDVLKVGPHGVGLIESDSYICDAHATKHLVADAKDEGYKISIEEYGDQRMLGILKDSLKRESSSIS